VGVWGLSFKAETDDIRESSSIKIIKLLLENGIKIHAHDPMAIENTKKVLGISVEYFDDQYDCISEVDCLILSTEWKQYRIPDFNKMKGIMNKPYILDIRNQYKVDKMKALGFHYYSVGRS
jgi:UDPglucose 6-dehydrogenase